MPAPKGEEPEKCEARVRASETAAANGLPAWFDAFLMNICEIPDRNSPEDEPAAMVATAEELRNCAANAIEQCASERAGGLDAPLQGWSVYVERNGYHFLTISNNHVAGDEITDDLAALVRTAASHLLSFVGADEHRPALCAHPSWKRINCCSECGDPV